MEMPPTPQDANETLAAIGHRIYRSFRSLKLVIRSYEDENSFTSALVNESQRFGLWAKNLGLYDLGHSSLDYRFRDAPVVYNHTRHLSVDLEKATLKIQQDLDRKKPGQEIFVERPCSPEKISDHAGGTGQDYDGDQGSDESSEDEDTLMSYQEDSISTIVLENARLIIDRLYKLSFQIRNPATRLGFSKARSYREIDEETGVDLMDFYASFDLRHVVEIVARHWRRSQEECENHYLVQRLAKANTHRRRQFGHWRRHKIRLESVNQAFSQMMAYETNAQVVSTLKVPRDSEKGAFSLPSTATRLDETKVNLNDSASAISSSTYAILFTEDDGNNVSIPPLPEKLCTCKEFECPYCHVLCSKRTSQKASWERHVLRDLRPYVCTYENCTEADQQYDGIKDWISHEINVHGDSETQFISPSQRSSDGLGKNQPSKLPVTPNDTCREECPICLEPNPSFVHIGRHLQRVAVFALPRSTGVEDEISIEGANTEAPTYEYRDSPSLIGSESSWADEEMFSASAPPRSTDAEDEQILISPSRRRSTQAESTGDSSDEEIKMVVIGERVRVMRRHHRVNDGRVRRPRKNSREEDYEDVRLGHGEYREQNDDQIIIRRNERSPSPEIVPLRTPDPVQDLGTVHTLPIDPLRHSDPRSYDQNNFIETRKNARRVPNLTRYRERRGAVDEGRSFEEKPQKVGMWTEIPKDLVSGEAIEELGYVFEETDYSYQIMKGLRYEDVIHLVNRTKDINHDRHGRERTREKGAERESVEPLSPAPIPSPPWDEESVVEREIVYDYGQVPLRRNS